MTVTAAAPGRHLTVETDMSSAVADGVSVLDVDGIPFDVLLRRKVRVLDPLGDTVELGTLSTKRAVILLGDPGMGKSTTLRALATSKGCKSRLVRAFLIDPSPATEGCPLFLDALDETMAFRNDRSVLDQVAAQLRTMNWPPFWLSCRHADWARSGGKSLLEECLKEGLAIAHLLPLEREDIERTAMATLPNASAFLKAMEEADLLPILENPESLKLTLEIFDEHGAPKSRSDLYEQATDHLARESNKTHAQADVRLPGVKVKKLAGAVAAALLLSGEDEVAMPGAPVARGVPVEDLADLITADEFYAMRTSRLFVSPEQDIWSFGHRTVAEYLAAKFLADKVSERHLTLRRALGMICDGDGNPKSSLRGVFAWLAVHLWKDADKFVGRDPYGVVVYGDAGRLTTQALEAVWEGLSRLVDVDPFFRSGKWHDPGFRAFCSPGFVPSFCLEVARRPVRPHLLSCIFDAVEHGSGLPTLATDLEGLILDGSISSGTRRAATFAYLNCASGDEAANLFRRLLSDEGEDTLRQFSSILLLSLYPKVLETADLCDFIVRYSELEPDLNQSLHLHLDVGLPGRVPAGTETSILDAMRHIPSLLSSDRRPSSPRGEMRRFATKLFARALTSDSFVTPERATTWLSLVDMAGESPRGQEELKAALAQRPDCYVPFLIHFAKATDIGSRPSPHAAVLRLRHRLPQIVAPADAVERLLTQVEAAPTSPDTEILYASAFRLMVWQNRADPALFERFWLAGSLGSHLIEIRDFVLCDDIQAAGWRWEQKEIQALRSARTVAELETRRTLLHAQIAGIREGTAADALSYLAAEWFRLHWHDDDTYGLPRPKRMAKLFTAETIIAAEDGFKAMVLSSDPPRPDEIAGWMGPDDFAATAYPMLAGADLLFLDNPDVLLGLPSERLMGLLCLGLTLITEAPKNDGALEIRPWRRSIIETFPDESHATLSSFVTALMERGRHGQNAITQILSADDLADIRNQLLPVMLCSVHPDEPYFISVVRAAAASLDLPIMSAIVGHRLSVAIEEAIGERWQWLLLAWRLSPEPYEAEIRAEVQASDERLLHLMNEIGSEHHGFHPSVELPLLLEHRILAVEIVGPRFPPVANPEDCPHPATDRDRAILVQRHILAVGASPGAESGIALKRWIEEPSLEPFRDSLFHALAVWDRHDRQGQAERPSPRLVARSLAGGPPTTSAELHSFVIDHLEDFRGSLKTDRRNVWTQFWNLNGASKPTNARPENECSRAVGTNFEGAFIRARLSTDMETQHVNNTRCDIIVRGRDIAVPIESKCDWNPDLWTGWVTQLRDRYACDHAARGFGVYLVFWFGNGRGKNRSVTRSPSGKIPATSDECQEILDFLMAEEAPKLVPIVMDLTPLPTRTEERKAQAAEKPPAKKGRKPKGQGPRKSASPPGGKRSRTPPG